ncbi:EXS-domain-containing protein [Fomitiporia mediterranea MF3/22]|uniref:EXS-domain-containing protein n=1 Tax=Fomitiporia mediterranea (strain MF3/22) TaxID=694068 RepID=UPI0004409759|nr:EXS-domain-containing protein [Fomitiporia mediterranea MF3/22]EJD02886.1 EXS-domain-containing protein [Fomitiporia mediterranea MF3/22]
MDVEGVPIEAPFAASFPLPFRVLVLAGTGILCWATNLHGLHILGIDAAAALDIRPFDANPHAPLRLTSSGPPDVLALARAVYRLCIAYAFVVFTGWALFRLATHGDLALVDLFKWMPAVTMLVVVMLAVSPFEILEKRVRDMFLIAVKRCLFSPSSVPVYFCDVVLADIFTSFAKVIGDVWLSFCMFMPGGSLLIFPEQYGWTRLMVPCLLSVPYAVRFRQCIIDYMQPTTTDKKQLYNALKYASSFPVIFLSAAQRDIASDLATEAEIEEHPLFRLWLLSVVVNSLYSFWWDVTNDWGLELLKTGQNIPRIPPKPLLLPTLQARRSSLDSNSPIIHARHPSLPNGSTNTSTSSPYTPQPSYSRRPHSYPWGLRPTLLFPLPAYPLAVFANLVLRLTWSFKLSAHLHAQVSGALLFFWLELAELLRRWVWVFFRVEWELVKREWEWERERGEYVLLQDRREGEEGDVEYSFNGDDGVGVGSGMEMGEVVNGRYDDARINTKIGSQDALP